MSLTTDISKSTEGADLADEARAVVSRVLTAAVLVISVATAPFLVLPALQPQIQMYKSVVHDCVDTKPQNRTLAQKENCRPGGPIGQIIPGVL